MTNAIRLDWSPYSTLAVCACGWRITRWNRADAWEDAAGHCMNVHDDADGSAHCRNRAYMARSRANR